jgi:hypothetical protein
MILIIIQNFNASAHFVLDNFGTPTYLLSNSCKINVEIKDQELLGIILNSD